MSYISATARSPAGHALASFLRHSLLFLLHFSVKNLEKPRVFWSFPFTPPLLNRSSVGFHRDVSELRDIKTFLNSWLIKPKFLDAVSSVTASCPLVSSLQSVSCRCFLACSGRQLLVVLHLNAGLLASMHVRGLTSPFEAPLRHHFLQEAVLLTTPWFRTLWSCPHRITF